MVREIFRTLEQAWRANGLTAAHIAATVGVSTRMLRYYKAGKVPMPLRTVIACCEASGIQFSARVKARQRPKVEDAQPSREGQTNGW